MQRRNDLDAQENQIFGRRGAAIARRPISQLLKCRYIGQSQTAPDIDVSLQSLAAACAVSRSNDI
jgi:hypothetical protein